MPKGRELVGLPVLNQERGEEVGRVQDLLYDEKSAQVKALVLAEGGWLQQPRVITFDKLQSRGPKTFTVAGTDSIDSELPAGLRRWQEIKGLRLLNRDGQELGLVEDLVVDLPSGQVKALEVSTGLVNDLLEGRREVPLTGDFKWESQGIIIW
ncbi:MAG: PRC-barrel domain-containing protein [Moorella humiferrea]|uniref:PRC-barrel domain protein n=1 Tax=Neomoorella humiferrea TaxID=676965 RepID=A0A2T0AY86_9FIRM|nr:PRC-barrel domain-containing protein [Moorella humiferrea]MBE3572017.1 PRC-barrel domain-containing protein [Moorella humiferrea]PRR75852.1 PRC-barrel domain protein [Moorella humiferrea]